MAFAFRSGRMALAYARKHRHGGNGAIALRCLRCAPLDYDDASSTTQRAAIPADDRPLRLADIQARNMDSRSELNDLVARLNSWREYYEPENPGILGAIAQLTNEAVVFTGVVR